jgi:hypothetical protein
MSLVHQNWWFTTLLIKQFKYCPPLSKSLKCDVLIVGGGVSGINGGTYVINPLLCLQGFKDLLIDNGMQVFESKRVIKDFKNHFPFLRDLPFIQFWPGLIDTTRDLLPIIAKPPTAPYLQFILGVVGLPWASFAGSFAAQNILGTSGEDYKKYYRYFSNRRHFSPAVWIGEDYRQATGFFPNQCLGEILSGGQSSKDRGDEGKVLGHSIKSK